MRYFRAFQWKWPAGADARITPIVLLESAFFAAIQRKHASTPFIRSRHSYAERSVRILLIVQVSSSTKDYRHDGLTVCATSRKSCDGNAQGAERTEVVAAYKLGNEFVSLRGNRDRIEGTRRFKRTDI